MGHNLNFKNGKASVFSTREMWHNLGTVVSEAQTSEEAIQIAQLDYEVGKAPLYTPGHSIREDGMIEVPEKYATIRKDTETPLGVVGSKYTVLQNKDAFRFFDEIVGRKEAIFEAAGAINKGETIFITAKLPERIYVGGKDEIETFLFLTNSHNGSRSVEVSFINHRVICENTLKLALQTGKQRQRVRHTASVSGSLLQAADLMGITREKTREAAEQYNALARVHITDPQLRKFIELAMHPGKEQIKEEEFSKRFTNQVDSVLEYAHSHHSQQTEMAKGTLFGAFNAITGFYNNVNTYRKADDRLQSLMYGTGFQNSNKALSLAMDVLMGAQRLS